MVPVNEGTDTTEILMLAIKFEKMAIDLYEARRGGEWIAALRKLEELALDYHKKKLALLEYAVLMRSGENDGSQLVALADLAKEAEANANEQAEKLRYMINIHELSLLLHQSNIAVARASDKKKKRWPRLVRTKSGRWVAS